MKKLHQQSFYEVQAIQDSKIDQDGNRFYLVKWKNWPSSTNTWEPVKNLITVRSLIDDFQQLQKEKLTVKTTIRKKIKKSNNIEKESQDIYKQSSKIQDNSDINQNEFNNEIKEVKKRRGRPKVIKPKLIQVSQEQIVKQTQDNKINKHNHLHSNSNLKSNRYVHAQKSQNKSRNHRDRSKTKSIFKAPSRIRNPPIMRRMSETIHYTKLNQKLEDQTKKDDFNDQIQKSDQLGIQEVLLQGKNYSEVKVTYELGVFYYQIPYHSRGEKLTFKTTASQIIKVNQQWLQGFFQGFYI